MSNHAVEVVPVVLEPHPNADSLSLVKVFGYQVAVRTGDWQGVEIGAYIPPDSIVPDTEQFAWLGPNEKDRRIRAKKLRGSWSMGMLVPAPEGSKVGDDVADILGVTHYEPVIHMSGDTNRISMGSLDSTTPPSGYMPRYDVEALRRYNHLFVPGEEVIATEKVHGANGRWHCDKGGNFHCGSRNEWKQESDSNMWWRALRQYPQLMEFLEGVPEFTAYGEVYGNVKGYRYGLENGKVAIALFDFWCDGSFEEDNGQPHWASYDDIFSRHCERLSLPRVPELYRGPFDQEKLEALAEGDTVLGNGAHIREGIVIKPVVERNNPEIGRVQLKIVSLDFLGKN